MRVVDVILNGDVPVDIELISYELYLTFPVISKSYKGFDVFIPILLLVLSAQNITFPVKSKLLINLNLSLS